MIGHDNTTSSLELDEVGKKLFGKRWLGVVPSDRVPPRRPDSYLIANLHTAAMPGLHWVCRYVDEHGNSAWHDPLSAYRNRRPTKSLIDTCDAGPMRNPLRTIKNPVKTTVGNGVWRLFAWHSRVR